jgi:hypothetical protein
MMGHPFPGLIPIANSALNCHAATLKVAVPHSRIQVERSILDILIQRHVVRAFVDLMGDGAPHVRSERRDEIRERIHERIGGVTYRVANRKRWQQR